MSIEVFLPREKPTTCPKVSGVSHSVDICDATDYEEYSGEDLANFLITGEIPTHQESLDPNAKAPQSQS